MEGRPYLSVVVTSRNDDHGGSMLRRMQTFTNAFIAQCKRFSLPAELIVVEWNPPADRPPLAEALTWPADTSPCEVRFVEVPPELHQRLRHAEALPLFQMIAKNVGIRRARGEYVLATNIDILLNDDLVRFLAERKLQHGRMYRIDRHDADGDVPVDGSVEEQLEYCRTHLLRVNAREGIFPVTPDGALVQSQSDVASADDGIRLGTGWYPLEEVGPWTFRWLGKQAAVELCPPDETSSLFTLEAESEVDGTHSRTFLEVRDAKGTPVAYSSFAGKRTLRFRLPMQPGKWSRFTIAARNEGAAYDFDLRDLNCQVNRCYWSDAGTLEQSTSAGWNSWEQVRGVVAEDDVVPASEGVVFGGRWFPPEAGEDECYRWFGQEAELIVRPPRHGAKVLNLLVEPGPGVRWRACHVVVKDESGNPIVIRRIEGRQIVSIEIATGPTCTRCFRLSVPEGGERTKDIPRIIDARVLKCWWGTVPMHRRVRRRAGRVARKIKSMLTGVVPVTNIIPKRAVANEPPPANTVEPPPFPRHNPLKPLLLHTMACGDFTMMALENWLNIRGYPEFDIYSFNIDSVGCYCAHHSGATEEILQEPMRIYHIEHGAGSGWTPEHEGKLKERLAAKAVPWLGYHEILRWALEMRRLDGPLIFNREDWGFGNEELPERTLSIPGQAPARPRLRVA